MKLPSLASCIWGRPSDGIVDNGESWIEFQCKMLEWSCIDGRFFTDSEIKVVEIPGFSSTGEPISIVFLMPEARSWDFKKPVPEEWLLHFLDDSLEPYSLILRVPLVDGFVKPVSIEHSNGELQHPPDAERVHLRFDERGCNSQQDAAIGSDADDELPYIPCAVYTPFYVLFIDWVKPAILFAALVDDLPMSVSVSAEA